MEYRAKYICEDDRGFPIYVIFTTNNPAVFGPLNIQLKCRSITTDRNAIFTDINGTRYRAYGKQLKNRDDIIFVTTLFFQ